VEQRRRDHGGSDGGEDRAGAQHVLHGQLPCLLGKVLGESLGSEVRGRGELGNGDPAAAAKARAPASRQFG
jgi:hypothetical protein